MLRTLGRRMATILLTLIFLRSMAAWWTTVAFISGCASYTMVSVSRMQIALLTFQVHIPLRQIHWLCWYRNRHAVRGPSVHRWTIPRAGREAAGQELDPP